MSLAERLKAMPPELRNAGIAAAALVVSMILPWYQKSFVPPGAHEFTQANLSAFGVFSFVEAAVLLVAVGVLFLVWARTNERAFHLPGGDGAVITAAGGWALLLLVWRLFDKPDAAGPSATIGIQWGIFGAMLAAGALIAAGARVRAAHRPEPPNPAADDFDLDRAGAPARDRRARTAARATRPPSPRCCATARRGRATRRASRRAAARRRIRRRSAWTTPARRAGATAPASRRRRTGCSRPRRFVQPRIEGSPGAWGGRATTTRATSLKPSRVAR